MHIYTHICVHTYTYTCIYAYILINIHVYILCRSDSLWFWGENWENFATYSFIKNIRKHILNVTRKRWERPEFLEPGYIQEQDWIFLPEILLKSLKIFEPTFRHRKWNIVWYVLHAESKFKKIKVNLFTKQKQTHRLREWIEGYGEGEGGGIVREFGIDMYTLLCWKWITNKDLRYSTGNSAQYYVTN